MPLAPQPSLFQVRRSAGVAILTLFILSVGLCGLGTLPPAQTAAALLVIWISAFPIFVYLQGWVAPSIPVIPFAGLYYLCFFALPVFFGPWAYHYQDKVLLYGRVPLDLIGWDTLLLVAAGIGCLWIGYYASRRFIGRVPSFRIFQSTAAPGHLTILYLVLLVASLSFRYSEFLRQLPSIGQFLDPAGYLALGGLFLQWRRNELSTCYAATIAIVVLPLELNWRLRHAMLTDLLMLVVFFAFIFWREKYYRVIAFLAVCGVACLLVYSAAHLVREATASAYQQSINISKAFVDTWTRDHRIEGTSSNGLPISWDARFSPLLNRVSQIWLFQSVYERTPDPVPYWGGETYRPLLTALIPRAIYPDKPLERAGWDFGRRYDLLSSSDNRTSVNIPWLTELFVNFGPFGVIAGMAIFGLLLAVLDKIFNKASANDLTYLIGLTVIFRLGYQESNFSVMTGSLPQLFACFCGYFWFGQFALRYLYGKVMVLRDVCR